MRTTGRRREEGRAYLRVQQQCQKTQSQTHLHSPEASAMTTGGRHHLGLQESARQRGAREQTRETCSASNPRRPGGVGVTTRHSPSHSCASQAVGWGQKRYLPPPSRAAVGTK